MHLSVPARRVRIGTVLAVVCVVVAGCNEPVAFTERPQTPASRITSAETETADPVSRTVLSNYYVATPIDRAALAAAVQGVFPDKLITVRQRVRRAACIVRNGRKRCNSADVRGDVALASPPILTAENGRIGVELPLVFNLDMKGRGRTSELQRTDTSTPTLTVFYDVAMGDDGKVRITGGDEWEWDNKPILEVFEKTLDLSASIPRNIRRARRTARQRLNSAVEGGVAKDLLEEAWRSASYPLRLPDAGPAVAQVVDSDGSTSEPAASSEEGLDGSWMRGDPQALHFAGIGGVAGNLSVRYAIPMRLTSLVGERPVPLIPVQMPELAEGVPELDRSRVLIPIHLPFDAVRRRLADAVPVGTELTGTGANPATFTVQSLDVFTANGLAVLAIELDGPATGRAYAIMRPSVGADGKTIDLGDITLTRAMPNPSLYVDGRFLLADLPIAEVFGDDLAFPPSGGGDGGADPLIARAEAEMSQRFSANLELTPRFSSWKIDSFEPVEDGLLLFVAFEGELALTADEAGSESLALETATTGSPN